MKTEIEIDFYEIASDINHDDFADIINAIGDDENLYKEHSPFIEDVMSKVNAKGIKLVKTLFKYILENDCRG